jgi:hypothetical protein
MGVSPTDCAEESEEEVEVVFEVEYEDGMEPSHEINSAARAR